jgi:DHA2 family methylenomycin A resistance protein-like MFS transporter
LLRRGPFSATTCVTFIIGVAWFGAFLFTSLFLQQVRHDSPVTAGAALLPWLVTLLVIAPLTEHLGRYVAPRMLVTIGLALLGAAFFLLSYVDADSGGYQALIPGLLLGGVGAALTIPLNGLALAGVDGRKAGVASGIFNTARETGGCLGVALTSAVVGGASDLPRAATPADTGNRPAQRRPGRPGVRPRRASRDRLVRSSATEWLPAADQADQADQARLA